MKINGIKKMTLCPFCGGSKITPFVRVYSSQECKMCDKNGFILDSKLKKMGLL